MQPPSFELIFTDISSDELSKCRKSPNNKKDKVFTEFIEIESSPDSRVASQKKSVTVIEV